MHAGSDEVGAEVEIASKEVMRYSLVLIGIERGTEMSHDREKCERLMRVCQRGYPASSVGAEYANNTLAECYGVIGSLIDDNDASSDLLRKLSAELECARGDLKTASGIIERYKKDAERYRFIRDDTSKGKSDICIIKKDLEARMDDYLTLEKADFAIDAAIEKDSQ